MGVYFGETVQAINGPYITTLRKVPISSGGLARIWLPGFFTLTKWVYTPCKEWRRVLYKKSGRYVYIYRINSLSDGIYFINSLTEDQEWQGYYFHLANGVVSPLDNANQAYDYLVSARAKQDQDISNLRRLYGYSLREIEHMRNTGQWDKYRCEEETARRYEIESKLATGPTENLPQG